MPARGAKTKSAEGGGGPKSGINTQEDAYDDLEDTNSAGEAVLKVMTETLEQAGYDADHVFDMAKGIVNFTMWDYKTINNSMRNWIEGDALKSGLWIESYIEKAAKYPSNRPVYRGIDNKDAYDFFRNLNVGDDYHFSNPTSTSSSLTEARAFAKNSANSVVLVINGSKMATSIHHLSSQPKEKEVLFSGRSNFKVTGKERDSDGRLVITLQTKGANKEWLAKYNEMKKKMSVS
jgi:hypothetical protein